MGNVVTSTTTPNKYDTTNPIKSKDDFLNEYVTRQMLRERSIAIRIIDLLTEEKVTYGEWKNIYPFVKDYIDYNMYDKVIEFDGVR